MNGRTSEPELPEGATRIYRRSGGGAADFSDFGDAPRDDLVGYISAEGEILRLRWGEGRPVGRCGPDRTILRLTAHGERELGAALETGEIRSAGLFEGGALGWMEPDGVVIRGGLILGEEEVGRVEGARALEAAAALLLLFLPDEAEADRRAARGA